MSSDHQVALTRTQRMPAPSPHISKATRQLVPAFLQKLYEMINDDKNAHLICWSEAGDSFFVLDHERFAHEVLGRWFKHRNFSSFVRQLNMYGFHKVPHLQQGVLKSDTETEFLNFAHPNFHRGQPDLLCLIQRKKTIQGAGEEGVIDFRDPNIVLATAPNPPPANTAPSSGQILDLITAIKRHQTTISAELNDLRRSNQLLWQDALATRAKHQKQQETVNRILKFLAQVFGHQAGGSGGVGAASPGVSAAQHGKEDGGDLLDGAHGQNRRIRLMIEDAKRPGPRKSMVEELAMDAEDAMYVSNADYSTIDTPVSIPSPAPSLPDNNIAAAESPEYSTPQSNKVNTNTDQGKEISRAVTPSRHSPTSFEFDPRMQGVLNQLSPAQVQQLLASLASQTFSEPLPPNPSSTVNPKATTNTSGSLTSYQPPAFDFSISPSSQYHASLSSSSSHNPVSLPHEIPFEHNDGDLPELQDDPRMERQWKGADEIDKDVTALNSSIHSLIQTFGLDPSLLDDHGIPPQHLEGEDLGAHGVGAGAAADGAGNVDFDFDTFFKDLSSSSAAAAAAAADSTGAHEMDYDDLVSTAFLDEVSTPAASSDLTASPVMQNLSAADKVKNANSKNLKRKSEVDFEGLANAFADEQASSTSVSPGKLGNVGQGKPKRRKDK